MTQSPDANPNLFDFKDYPELSAFKKTGGQVPDFIQEPEKESFPNSYPVGLRSGLHVADFLV